MEHVTDAQTAVDLKSKIKDARKVIYVVTTESLKSAWCSWEIGYSDCAKGVSDVAILAVSPIMGDGQSVNSCSSIRGYIMTRRNANLW